MLEESNDEHQPRLQHEYAGGGPGSRIRIAVGAGDNSFIIDSSVLPDPPWWFLFVNPWLNYKERFCLLPLEFALLLLERTHVPPLYRLGLGFQWGFLDTKRDGFSRGEFTEILRELKLLHDPLDVELKRIEKRSKYQIWRRLKVQGDLFGNAQGPGSHVKPQ